MKKLVALPILLIILLMHTACSDFLNPDILGTSNLPGTWDISNVTQKQYTNGILDSTDVQTDLGTMTFNSGGDGSYLITQDDETNSGTFDWFEKNDKVFLNMMNLSDSVMTENLAIAFDVDTDSPTRQVWSLSYSFYEDDEDQFGNEVTYLKRNDATIELEKQ